MAFFSPLAESLVVVLLLLAVVEVVFIYFLRYLFLFVLKTKIEIPSHCFTLQMSTKARAGQAEAKSLQLNPCIAHEC